MLSQLLTLALAATTALAMPLDTDPSSTTTTTSAPTPTPTRVRPPRDCTIVTGENPYVIANYTRPACVCNCLVGVCQSITVCPLLHCGPGHGVDGC